MPNHNTYTEALCQSFQELRKAVEEVEKEMRKSCLGRFVLKLLELKVRIDMYLNDKINKMICIVKGHDPMWFDVGTDNSHKYCLRCKKRWYRYRDGK